MKDQHLKIIRLFAVAGLFAASVAHAMLVHEKFAADPAPDGWRIFGNTNLFQWDPTNQVLDVTWDSSQTNSYFYHPLGRTLTTNDSFCVLFDLQLSDAAASGYGSELAVGLLNFPDATNAAFSRGGGTAPNLFEFDYFPAVDFQGQSYPPSLDATLKDSQPGYAGLYWVFDNLTLNPGVTYRVVLIHRVGESAISGVIYTNGQVFTALPIVDNYGPVGGFQFDTLSISSYTDDGYGNSILAHGTVGNLACASPLPVGMVQTPAAGQVQFASDTNWFYTLEQSADFQKWTAAAPAIFGNGTNLLLQATNSPVDQTFYRVRADLP